MAIYHYNMHSNKVGISSAVAHAAYISGSQLYNDRTGKTHDYSKKENITCQTLLFPEWVVPMSREELWNIVESKIKTEGRNYGKTGDFAIPNEWLDTMSDEEITAIVAKFFIENFVSKGYAVDFAFHKKDGNPHIDYFVPQMKFDENGELVPPKVKSVFANVYNPVTKKYEYNPELPSYDRKDHDRTNQYRFPVIDPKTGEQKIRNRKGGKEKVWERVNYEDDSLNTKDFLKQLRKSWQDTANQYLDKDHKIDCRSLAEQGITDREPDIHISSAVLAMEKKNPGSTEKMKRHNDIKDHNNRDELRTTLRKLQAQLEKLKGQIFLLTKKTEKAIKAELVKLHTPKKNLDEKDTQTWIPPRLEKPIPEDPKPEKPRPERPDWLNFNKKKKKPGSPGSGSGAGGLDSR